MISRTARVDDLFAIELQPAQVSGDPRPFLPEEFTDEHLNTICARTAEIDGRIIACYGLTPCQPGVAEAWALLSEESLQHGRELTEDVLHWLEWAEAESRLRRVQATVREEHAAAHRWMRRLGFEPEGRMRGFGMDGGACWLYGRIPNGRDG